MERTLNLNIGRFLDRSASERVNGEQETNMSSSTGQMPDSVLQLVYEVLYVGGSQSYLGNRYKPSAFQVSEENVFLPESDQATLEHLSVKNSYGCH